MENDYMNANDMVSNILDAIPYPIVFVDPEHVIRYMNKRARYHYHEERGYLDLIGKSLFECHGQQSRKAIEEVVEQFKNHRHEVFLKVSDRNERIYITPVRDEHGNLVGYFERFEKNFTKT